LLNSFIQYINILKINIDEHFALSLLLLCSITFIIVGCALPLTTLIIVVAGYLFGTSILPLILICISFGALGPYYFMRYTMYKVLRKRAVYRIDRIKNILGHNQIFYLICLRLIPWLPFPVTSAIAGILKTKPLVFLISTFIGSFPACLTLILIGRQMEILSQLDNNISLQLVSQPGFIITTTLVLIIIVLPILITKKYHMD